jgi:PAS domain S-box-containing protein
MALASTGRAAVRDDPHPSPQTESWRVVSFLEAAGLTASSIFTLDFERDGAVWVAASSGLYHFDGYVWERLGVADGLPSDHVRSVCVLRDGTLWVGTDRGAGTLGADGFDPMGSDAHLPGPSVRRIVEDPDGSVWFCCDRWPDRTVRSGLARLKGGVWTTWDCEDGLPDDYVSDVFVSTGAERFVLTNAGLARFVGEELTLVAADLPGGRSYVWSMAETGDGVLIAVTADGFLVREDGVWHALPSSPRSRYAKLTSTSDGDVLSCYTGAGASFVRWNGSGFETATDSLPYAGHDVQFVREAPDGSVWAVGDALLVRWERRGGRWDAYEGLPPATALDEGGGVWFADTERVLRRFEGEWTSFEGCSAPLCLGPDGATWMRSGAEVVRWTADGLARYGTGDTGLDVPRRFYPMESGELWVVGERGGRAAVSLLKDGDWTPLPIELAEAGEAVVDLVAPSGGDPWILLARSTPRQNRLIRLRAGGSRRVDLVDRATEDGALQLHVHEGELWIHGFSGLHVRDDDGWRPVTELAGGAVYSVVERPGETWVATTGATGGERALSRLAGGVWTHFPYGVWHLAGRGRDGSAFYSAREGLLSLRNWNETPTVHALPDSARIAQAVPDASGGVWITVVGRVLHYRPDPSPPETLLLDGPDSVDERDELGLRVRGVERFAVASAPYRVESRLDDGPWVDRGLQDDEFLTFAVPEVGPHILSVRLIDSDRDVDPTPATWEFDVRPTPLQARSWFLPALIGTLLVIAGLAFWSLSAWKRLRVQARRLESVVRARTSELRASEREYRSLFEQSHDAVLVVDLGGDVIDANREALQLFDSRPDELRGRPVTELLPDVELEASRVVEESTQIECSGEARELVVGASARRDERGEVIGSQVIVRDVTDQRRIEGRLHQGERMEAVGRMASAIAHDFNNMLTGVLGNAELLKRDLAVDPKQSRRVGVILDGAERARELTKEIQFIGRSGPKESDGCDVHAVLVRLEPLLRSVVESEVELVIRRGARDSFVGIDPAHLERTLINLAVNARDAMGADGTLTIETRNTVDSAGTPALTIAVRDTGEGMDESTRQHIFEPFFSTKGGSGSGLGLAIVYGVVDQCNGSIDVKSVPGRGSTFDVHLPLSVPGATPSTQDPVLPTARSSHEHVLVVEDQRSIRDLISGRLTELGYRVVRASNAADALELAVGREFDLIITDVVMPGMRGDELAQRLRAAQPGVRILFVSGHFDPDSLGAPLEGALLAKPFTLDDLDAAVSEALGLLERDLDPLDQPLSEPR